MLDARCDLDGLIKRTALLSAGRSPSHKTMGESGHGRVSKRRIVKQGPRKEQEWGVCEDFMENRTCGHGRGTDEVERDEHASLEEYCFGFNARVLQAELTHACF